MSTSKAARKRIVEELGGSSYGFTAYNSDKNIIDRILEESDITTDFVVIRVRNRITDRQSVLVVVRALVLEYTAEFEQFYLGDLTLEQWKSIHEKGKHENKPFLLYYFEFEAGEDREADKAVNTLRNQIRRIKNALEGFTTEVTVESY